MSRLRWFLLVAVDAPGAAPLSAQLVQPNVIVSVRDQKLMLLDNGGNAAVYPVSTSKFGLGDRWGSMATPLGTLRLLRKSVTARQLAPFFTTAVSPAKFCSRIRQAAILSLPELSGCAVWKLKMRMLITGAFTFTARRRRRRSAGPPATVVFE